MDPHNGLLFELHKKSGPKNKMLPRIKNRIFEILNVVGYTAPMYVAQRDTNKLHIRTSEILTHSIIVHTHTRIYIWF